MTLFDGERRHTPKSREPPANTFVIIINNTFLAINQGTPTRSIANSQTITMQTDRNNMPNRPTGFFDNGRVIYYCWRRTIDEE